MYTIISDRSVYMNEQFFYSCFGESSVQYLPMLEEYIKDEIRDSRYYELLMTRFTSRDVQKLLSEISKDELMHAKNFSAAYYLISKNTFFPSYRELEPVQVPSTFEALRTRFFEENKAYESYMNSAREATQDKCLSKLLEQISEDEKRHANTIFEILKGNI